ncbi:MAG: hypothetical protein J7K68_06180 [Candidatus Diapherotrites archaeon]|nr:hypothetical protein [Candidatus Diapherotrites archaeon]
MRIKTISLTRSRGIKQIFDMFKNHPSKSLEEITASRRILIPMAASRSKDHIRWDADAPLQMRKVLPTVVYHKRGFKQIPSLIEVDEKYTMPKEPLLFISPDSFSHRRFVVITNKPRKQFQIRLPSVGHPPSDFVGVLQGTIIFPSLPLYFFEREIPRSLVIQHFLSDKVEMKTRPSGLVRIEFDKKGPLLYKESLLPENEEALQIKKGDVVDVSVHEIIEPHARLGVLHAEFFKTLAAKQLAKELGIKGEGLAEFIKKTEKGNLLIKKKKKMKDIVEGIFRNVGSLFCKVHNPGEGIHIILNRSTHSDVFEILTGRKTRRSTLFAGEGNPHNIEIGLDGSIGIASDFSYAIPVRTDGSAPEYIEHPKIPQKVKVWKVSKEEYEHAAAADLATFVLFCMETPSVVEILHEGGIINKRQFNSIMSLLEERKKLLEDLGKIRSEVKMDEAYIKHREKANKFKKALIEAGIEDLDAHDIRVYLNTNILVNRMEDAQLSPAQIMNVVNAYKDALESFIKLVDAGERLQNNKEYLEKVRKTGQLIKKLARSKATKKVYGLLIEGYSREYEQRVGKRKPWFLVNLIKSG